MQICRQVTASLREIAALLRDACTSMDKAEAQAKGSGKQEIGGRE